MLCGRAAVGISRFLAYFRAITPYISVVVCGTGAPWCTLYIVLGDDVVIVDQEVAKVYESALGRLGEG